MVAIFFFIIAISFQACYGQSSVECFIGSNSCATGTSGVNASSALECCQMQPSSPTSFRLLNGLQNMCTSCPVVTFGFKPVSPVREDSNYVEVCVISLDGDIIDTTITVTVNTMDETATGFNDYNPLSDEQLVFSSGDTKRCINVSLVDDDEVEGQEYFSVTASSDDQNGLINGSLTVTIVDNDMVVIGISDPLPVNVNEADPLVTVKIEVISGKLETEVDLLVSTVDVSARGEYDYVPLSNMSVTLSGQQTSQSVEVELKEDSLVEGAEVFKVSVELSDPGISGVMLSNPEKDITIRDNDRATIGFIASKTSIGEESPSIEVCFVVKSGDISKDIVISVSISGQGVEGTDFGNITGAYTISGSVSEGCVVFEPNDDLILEGDEVTSVKLSTEDADTHIDNSQFDITIIDNEEVEFRFANPSKVYSEDTVDDTMCIEMIPPAGGIQRPISITVGKQVSTGSDVLFETVNLMFSNSLDVVQCASLTINDDSVVEGNEEAVFLLSSIDRAAVFNTSLQTFIVQDNDVARLGFKPVSPVREDLDYVSVCLVSLDGDNIRTTITVKVNTVDETATGFNDYNPLSDEQFVFSSGDTERCINVSIVDDDEVEGQEYFSVTASSDDKHVSVQGNLTVKILDNDAVPVTQLCNISNQLLLETFHAVDSIGFVYDFSEGCEHILISSCDPSTKIEIRIDFLHGNFSSGQMFVDYKGQKLIVDDNNMIKKLTDHPDIIISRENDNLKFELINIGINLTLSTSFINVYYDGMDASLLPLINGLCGSLNGELQLEDCQGAVNASNGAAVDVFIDSYKVKQTKLTLRPQRMECGLTDNSTVVGDPLFSTPLLPYVSDISGQTSISLCYEIHGESGTYFNLISDECTTVNAHYTQPSAADYLNVIDVITIIAVDNENQCHEVQVDVDGCTSSYDGLQLARWHNQTFFSNGIEIRLYSSRVYISTPNCADVSLSMWIACQNQLILDPYTDEPLGTVPMLKFVINGGLNVLEYSHGLIGQFWNIPVNITRYEGQLNGQVVGDPSNYYVLSVNHKILPVRRFVGLVHFLTWSHENSMCLYAGDRQGGPISEVEDPNDPVIEGEYKDYIVQSRFDTEFKYSLFKKDICDT